MDGGAATPRFDLGPAPFVGRRHERGVLSTALAAALGGRGGVILIGGEPGIGKTRLATIVADEFDAQGVPVWSARCSEYGTAPAFWPWNAALRCWVEHASDTRARDAAGPFASELAHVFPVLPVRTQISHLAVRHPLHAVRMGTVCVYAPSTRVEWDV